MKKLHFILVGVFLLMLQVTFAQSETAQVPVIDPDTNCRIRYYYYPNLEAYFDTKKNVFLFTQKGEWITAKEIPTGYRGYSLYNKVSVFITDYDDDHITQFVKTHRKKYPYIFNARQVTAYAEH